jgi:hypothetical protein
MLAMVDHRPYPIPTGRAMMFQGWDALLFAHWSFPADIVRALVPPQLDLETFNDAAWVGLVPFRMRGVRVLGTPTLGRLSNFPEVNLRTYVSHRGTPGVYFFSLDTTSRALIYGARMWLELPYFMASMAMRCDQTAIRIRSIRSQSRNSPASLIAAYGPSAPATQWMAGTLEHFLVERYRVYSVKRSGAVTALDVHHGPWNVAPAQARIKENSMLSAAGLKHMLEPELLHYSERQDVLLWPARSVSS